VVYLITRLNFLSINLWFDWQANFTTRSLLSYCILGFGFAWSWVPYQRLNFMIVVFLDILLSYTRQTWGYYI